METKRYESENQFEYANIIFNQLNEIKKIESDKLYSEIRQRQMKEVSINFIIEK